MLKIVLDGSFAGSGAAGLTLGDNSTVEGLVIDRFTANGIVMYGTGDIIRGNFLGIDVTGTTAYDTAGNPLGNFGPDIEINYGTHDLIGGASAADRNVISGAQTSSANTGDGIFIIGGQDQTTVQGNFIGTDITGTRAFDSLGRPLGNAEYGLRIGADQVTIAGNVISGNFEGGVWDEGSQATLINNFIGTDVTGATALANGNGVSGSGDGVNLLGNSNQVGEAGAGNLISGNGSSGVFLSPGSGSQVQGNFIGVDVTGTSIIANTGVGLFMQASSGNVVGGTTSGARNIVSDIQIDGFTGTASGNVVEGNYIGTDVSGTKALGTATGVDIGINASNNTIGGTTAGARNVINGPGLFGDLGVYVGTNGNTGQPFASGNVVEGNYIGVNSSANMVLSHFSAGIMVDGATDTTIGGTVTGAGNVIAGAVNGGVKLGSNDPLKVTTVTLIEGNFIGVNAGGTILGDSTEGVSIGLYASNNVIGGTTPGAGNVIAGNATEGVGIDTTTGNQVLGNSIYGNGFGITDDDNIFVCHAWPLTPAVSAPQHGGTKAQMLCDLLTWRKV